jgi:ribosome-associated protein YbcJ (S4-like RNA binding protein)
MGGACSTNGEKRKACKLLVGKPEATRKTKTYVGDSITMDLVEVG